MNSNSNYPYIYIYITHYSTCTPRIFRKMSRHQHFASVVLFIVLVVFVFTINSNTVWLYHCWKFPEIWWCLLSILAQLEATFIQNVAAMTNFPDEYDIIMTVYSGFRIHISIDDIFSVEMHHFISEFSIRIQLILHHNSQCTRITSIKSYKYQNSVKSNMTFVSIRWISSSSPMRVVDPDTKIHIFEWWQLDMHA